MWQGQKQQRQVWKVDSDEGTFILQYKINKLKYHSVAGNITHDEMFAARWGCQVCGEADK